MLFVKGSDLPGVSNRFTSDTKHYVYPETCYSCRCVGSKICSNVEVTLLDKEVPRKIKKELYPANTTHFFFVRTGDINVNLQINRGRATALNYDEAKSMHNYLLDQGMICVQRVITEGRLFERLVKESERLVNPRTSRDYLQSALPSRQEPKADVLPSFFYEKGEPSIEKQITDINNMLSALEEREKRKERSTDRPRKRARH